MPIARYEIRNEYSLADPELYRAADKDDPEALLEGVAMAGLVGLLRQLGDLAEFASEIFHDLHEEVMATAARGHSLTIRVQQLETEVPSIERAFLSQTDHSPFFYNSGVDWHPNLRMDQSLITQGDLPRCVMDSYEECRGPPRLFLLDKFDLAGAGACLKRYTDPSFFKVETSAISEKKIRKPKKKGPRWRIGEAREGLPMSHAKIHQLFLDEPVENGVDKPARRGKLRRRLNGFPFDPNTGKNYMEKLWRSPSPEHKMLHEITTRSSLQLPSNDHDDSDHEVLEVRSVSPDREVVGRKRSPPPQDREEIVLKPFTYGANESDEVTNEKDITLDGERNAEGSLTSCQSDDVASEIDNYVDAPSTMESEMDTDSELRMKNDFTSYNQRRQLISLENEEHLSQSSDSQSTSDLKLSDEGNNSSKKETSSFSSSDSRNTSPEKPQTEEMSADIPGIANTDASSYQKGADEAFSVNQLPKPVVSDNTCTDEYTHTNKRNDSEQMTSTFTRTFSTPNRLQLHYGSKRVRKSRLWGPNSDDKVSTSDHEEKKINLIVNSQCSTGVSDSKSRSGDDSPRCSSREHPLNESNGANEPCMSADSDDVYHGTDSSAATSNQLLHENGYDRKDLNQSESTSSTLNTMPNVLSPDRVNIAERISARNPIIDKLDGEVLTLPESVPAEMISVATSSQLLHENGYDWKDLNQSESTSSTLNMVPNVLTPDRVNTAEMISARNPITDKLDGEVLKLPESAPADVSDVRDTAHNGDIMTQMVPDGEQLNEDLKIEESNVVSDVSELSDTAHNGNIITPIVSSGKQVNDGLGIEDSTVVSDASPAKELIQTSLHNAETLNAEEHLCSGSIDHQISSEILNLLPNKEGSPDWPEESVDAHDIEVIPEEDAAVDETLELQSPKSCEAVGLQGGEITDDVPPNEFVALENSSHTPENLADQAGDGIRPYTEETGVEVTEVSSSSDLKPMDQVHVQLDESDFQRDQPEAEAMASSLLAGPDDAMEESVNLPVELGEFVEENTLDAIDNDESSLIASHVDSDFVEEENNYLVEHHEQSGLVEEVDEREAITSDLYTDSCRAINNYIPQLEVSHTVPNSHLDTKVVDATQIQLSLEQSRLDTDQESIQLNIVESQVSDETSLTTNLDTEEKMLQEKIELPPEETDQNWLSLLPTDDQKMLDHEDHKENNSPLSFSLVNYPPSDSKLPGVEYYDNGVSECPRDTFSFIIPPSNPFSGTNQMNLDELPPLPPLPPVQWRMGKLQHSSSTTEEEAMMHNKEIFPQLISLPTPSTEDVSSSFEEMNHSPSQTAPETTYKDEKVEHKTIDTPLEIENKHPQLFMPASKSEATTSAEEDGVASESQTKKLPTYKEEKVEHKTVDTPPEIENKHPQLFLPASKSDVTISAEEDGVASESQTKKLPTYEEEKVEHKTIDTQTEIENKHLQLFMPASKSEATTSAEEDGVASESQTKKLPRPRNPLVEDVSVLDKSKLRKVIERVMPQTQKVDERDTILEQIRAKSFNLKPAASSRPTIRGPKTNLQVAAILEKANAIRQAFAGSDDDEEDWSDS